MTTTQSATRHPSQNIAQFLINLHALGQPSAGVLISGGKSEIELEWRYLLYLLIGGRTSYVEQYRDTQVRLCARRFNVPFTRVYGPENWSAGAQGAIALGCVPSGQVTRVRCFRSTST